MWLLERDVDRPPSLWALGLALGLAGMARAQVAPAVAILTWAALLRTPRWQDAWKLWPLPALTALTLALNQHWYGHPLGPWPRLLALQPASHMVSGSLNSQPWVGVLGLLVSANRGVLVFSPIVLVAAAGIWAMRGRSAAASTLRWQGAAALALFATYASFSVWWAGYTYGPRYVLDVLPMVVPLAAAGTARLWHRWLFRAIAIPLLAWSIAVSAIGAFCYTAVMWNSDPDDVDLRHERIWDWHDFEIGTCYYAGWHADNFTLFDRRAFRRP